MIDGAKAVVAQAEAGVVVRRIGAHLGRRSRSDRHGGLSLFLVPADAPGVTVRGYPAIDGGRVADLTLAGVTLGRATRCSAPKAGRFATLEHAIGRGVLALCAEALGAMDVARKGDARVPADAAPVRRADRQFPGAAAPDGRHAARDRAGALGGDQRRQRRRRRRPDRRASGRCRRRSSRSAGSARWWPRRASRCTAASE